MEAKSPIVSLEVGGQLYRIVSSAPEDDLRRLAAVVDARVRSIVPRGKPATPNAILLAAIALAHDLEDERAQRQALESRSRDLLRRLLARIDEALEHPDPEAQPGDGASDRTDPVEAD
jgi:cell division protein ZapA